MKELVKNLERIDLDKAKGFVLLDTCFIISLLDHNSKLPLNSATTSFNIEELMHVEHKLNHELKKKLRKFLKNESLKIINIDVHPGDWKAEKVFVNSVDSELLKHIPDASDAVLLAAAIRTNSVVLTKDKHHLFTVELENFLNKYDLKVFKELKDIS